jgi:hypothetical protein
MLNFGGVRLDFGEVGVNFEKKIGLNFEKKKIGLNFERKAKEK